MSFLFTAGLLALPLAALPVVLHLLLKQKTPVVPFSTLRFIKTSVQRTAARRKVRQWLLLACRVVLLGLLIWAIAQPVRTSVAGWLGGGRSVVAAIVVDTSYSMLDQDAGKTRLAVADADIRDLLRDDLSRAKVAVFRSQRLPDQPATLQSASGLLSEWSTLKPHVAKQPLVDRVAAAVALLDREPADDKWLVVISDFQSREFPHPMPAPKGGRVVLIDLQPSKARSAGVTAITVSPDRLIAGVGATATVRVIGSPGQPRALSLTEANPANPTKPAYTFAPVMATPDSTGNADVRFNFIASAARRTVLTATLTAPDSMAWDNQRSVVVESPARQTVTVLNAPAAPDAERFIRLALDPSEGKSALWPVRVQSRSAPTGHEDVIVAPLMHWPTTSLANRLVTMARSGRTVVLFLSPELADSWSSLPQAQQQLLLELLPSAPLPHQRVSVSHATLSDSASPLFDGLTDQSANFDSVTVRRAVPLSANGDAIELLGLTPIDPATATSTSDSSPGLCFAKPIGAGSCYTFATLPDDRSTNFATQPLFLPLLVGMAMPTAEHASTANLEMDQPIVFDRSIAPDAKVLQVDGPGDTRYAVRPMATDAGSSIFRFDHTDAAGEYSFHHPNSSQPLAVAVVSPPATESELMYRPAASIAPSGCPLMIAKSINDLHARVAAISEPQPHWSLPVAIVMLLLCAEAALGSLPGWSSQIRSTSLVAK